MSDPNTNLDKNPSSPFASWTGDHIGLRVPDVESAIAWYKEKLDFRTTKVVPRGEITLAFLSPANDDSFQIELLAGPGAAPRPEFKDLKESRTVSGWHHYCLRVDDLDASLVELKKRGVVILGDPMELQEIKRRLIFFRDPWGNIFELSEGIE